MITFNTDNMVAQEFPFPAPIMDYIFKNVSAAQLLKLYKTCKFFYAKFRLNIIEDFEIREGENYERIVGNSMAIRQRNSVWSKLNNLWISNSFTFVDMNENLGIDHSKVARLTIDKLEFVGELFFVEDFQFLVKCPTLRHLIISGKVHDMKNERNLSLEEIIEQAPQVSTFDITQDSFSEEEMDMTKLIALNRQTKITSLHLHSLFGIPDPLLVIEFFKKHAVPDIEYFFDIDPVAVEEFYKIINEGIFAWKLSLELPPALASSSFIDLTGKTAVITGALDGIGRATVILFRQLGASVIAVARNNLKLKQLTEECQNIKSDGFIHTISIDTFNDFDTELLLGRIECCFGLNFDILVVNVDPSRWYSVPNVELEQEPRENLYALQGHYNLLHAATPYLAEAKGTIINVSTSSELVTKPENTVSVFDLERYIKATELLLATASVRTNTVSPGASLTTLPRPDGINDADYKTYLQNLKKSRDQQVANAIAFLASDAAKSFEGAVLPVNAINLL